MGAILGLSKNKRLAIAAGLTTLALAGGAGIAAASGVFSQELPPRAPAPAIAPAQLTEHFAVLAAEAKSTDAPASLQNTTAGLDQGFGINPSLAKEVSYSSTTPDVWVIPGSQGVCIHVMTKVESGGCTSIKNALAGNLQIEVGGKTLYGLAPDGNTTVAVHDASGNTEEVPVRQNVYAVANPAGKSVELVDGTGQKRTITLQE